MRILVTGSAGFVGGHLVTVLTDHGHIVAGLDRKIMTPPEGVRHFVCDILYGEAVKAVLTEFQPEAVVHLAANTDINDAGGLAGYATNFDGVRHLIEAIRQTPAVQRAIFTSSQAVCRVGHIPENETDYAPATLYAESKVQTERVVRELNGGGVIWCLVRPPTVWGPGMIEHYRRFFRMVAIGIYVHVGHRVVHRPFGYVGNLVYQYERLLSAPSETISGKTFNLGDYEPLPIRGWTDSIQRALGARPIRTIPVPVAKAVARVGDLVKALGVREFPFTTFRLNNLLTEYFHDLTETARICGPLPYTMDEGVELTVRWLRQIGVVPMTVAEAGASASIDPRPANRSRRSPTH
jgi:nucleoside-diphosphate-sugar epimerase